MNLGNSSNCVHWWYATSTGTATSTQRCTGLRLPRPQPVLGSLSPPPPGSFDVTPSARPDISPPPPESPPPPAPFSAFAARPVIPPFFSASEAADCAASSAFERPACFSFGPPRVAAAYPAAAVS